MPKRQQPSPEETRELVQQMHTNFNKLPESTMQPILMGVFLLGVASAFFSPFVVTCMVGVFGVSAGLTYAAAANKTIPNIPNWMLASVGVATAMIYGVAGVPGLFLSVGLIGGWHFNTKFSPRFEAWKETARDEINKLKANPVRQTINLLFKGLYALSDFLAPKEIIPQDNVNANQQENRPENHKPEEASAVIPQVQQQQNAVILSQSIPDIAPIRFLGEPLPVPKIFTHKQEKKIDFNSYWGIPGFFKLFFYSFNPMIEIKPVEAPKPKAIDFNAFPEDQKTAMLLIMAKLFQEKMKKAKKSEEAQRLIEDKTARAGEAATPAHPIVPVTDKASNNEPVNKSPLTESILGISKGVAPSVTTDEPKQETSKIGRFFGVFFSHKSSNTTSVSIPTSTPSNNSNSKGYKKAIFCKELPEDYLYQDKKVIYLQRDKNRVIAYYNDGKQWIETSKAARSFKKTCSLLADKTETMITQPEKLAQITDFYGCAPHVPKSFFTFG